MFLFGSSRQILPGVLLHPALDGKEAFTVDPYSVCRRHKDKVRLPQARRHELVKGWPNTVDRPGYENGGIKQTKEYQVFADDIQWFHG